MVFGHVLMEFLLLNLSILIVFFSSSKSTGLNSTQETFLSGYFPLFVIFNASWILTVILNEDSGYHLNKSISSRVKFLLFNSLLIIGTAHTISSLFGVDFGNRFFLAVTISLFFLLDFFLFRLRDQYYERRKKTTVNSKALIVGGGKQNQQLPDFTETVQHHGYQVVGWLNGEQPVHVASAATSSFPVTGHIKDLSNVLATTAVDEIFIGLSSMEEEDIKRAVMTADYHGVRVNLVPDTPNFLTVNFKPSTVENLPVYQLRKSPLDQFNNFLLKTIFDFLFASFVILLLSPIFLIITLLIYIEGRGKGPLFYTPIRKGEKGASFKCYKFRTMSVCDDPVNGTQSTIKDDPRITFVGKYLRKYDLDELPQFLNVLKGDMSVVGPRPHRVHLHDDFRKIVNEYMVRHYVKPGITGWAQVNGWRGPTKTEKQKKERVRHDLWYIENWSFWLDLKIIWLTVFGRKTRKNAF